MKTCLFSLCFEVTGLKLVWHGCRTTPTPPLILHFLRLTPASHKGESIAPLQACLGPFGNENSLINLLPYIYHIKFWKFSFLLLHICRIGQLIVWFWLVAFSCGGVFCLVGWLVGWGFLFLFFILKFWSQEYIPEIKEL